MWNCPVCEEENTDTFCTKCGFDSSCSWETYPTLTVIPANSPAVSLRRADRQLDPGAALRCSGCGSSAFSVYPEQNLLRCTQCRKPRPLVMVSPKPQPVQAPGAPAAHPIAISKGYAAVRKADGTVVTIGRGPFNYYDIDNWTNITAIAAGQEHTAGLHSDGTAAWSDITAIAAGYHQTVGIRKDGAIVAAGQFSKS